MAEIDRSKPSYRPVPEAREQPFEYQWSNQAGQIEVVPIPAAPRERAGQAARRPTFASMSRETDGELVRAVQRGSREAAGKLLERYLRPTRAVALSILQDEQAAEDVCQDAFVYSIERIADCREPDHFAGWLMQIVRHRCLNYRRDSKADRMVTIEERTAESTDPAPDRSAERSELRQRLLEALGELPEDRRTVLLLHDLEGWTHREIAEVLEIPAGTVRSHLHHARKVVRSLMGEPTEWK